jgi:hypothetical protein
MSRRAVRTTTGMAAGLAAMFALAGQASAATSLIGAYDKYVSGKGFEIGLVDLGTGQNISLPTGVNTAADEIHPALTANGRFLVFTRMQVTPLLNGDVIPPSERTIVMFDRTTGVSVPPFPPAATGVERKGAGATITPGPEGEDTLAFGLRPTLPVPDGSTQTLVRVGFLRSGTFNAANPLLGTGSLPAQERSNTSSVLDLVHATVLLRSGGHTRAYARLRFDPGTGATTTPPQTVIDTKSGQTTSSTEGTGAIPAATNHPAVRSPDGYVAFDLAPPQKPGDLRTILFPGQTASDLAPAPITSSADERMPAWSSDATKLAFVRAPAIGGTRQLLVYDTTAGLQTIVNTGVALGTPAPTGQLRAFHDAWGGIALATETRADAVAVNCAPGACLASLSNANLSQLTLKPKVNKAKAKPVPAPGPGSGPSSIGIVLARVTGTRRLLGRTVPKIKPLGRVPLGLAVRGTNRFRWNGKVAGRRLTAGQYLLTFRALTQRGRVRSTSKSIRFRVTSAGRIVSPRVVR